MASESHQRRPVRVMAEPVDIATDPHAVEQRLRELVEHEDAAGAEAVLRAALQRGWDRTVIEPWLYGLCADHFLDFGHALIYQVKIFDLLQRVGWAHADTLLPAHLVGIVSGTREDTLPQWAWLSQQLDGLAPRFAAFAAGARKDVDSAALVAALLDARRDEMLATVVSTLEGGASLRTVVDALSLAAAHRILRFDAGVDADPTVQEGWLDVTHLLTYTHALRHAVQRYARPDVMRLVLFGCRFVSHAGALDAGPQRRLSIVPGRDPVELETIEHAVRQRDAAGAVTGVATWLAQNRPVDALVAAFEQLALDDPLTRPIVVTHLIKTGVAAFEEHRVTGRPEPLLAVFRLAASAVRERPVRRLAHEAIRFVVDGKVPRTLT
jgi:hypothetical protein